MNNTTGNGNVATGSNSMVANSTGNNNVAYGGNSLMTNSAGYQNTAIGNWALEQNSTGFSNTAIGASALRSNTIGSGNIALGENALTYSTTGSNCTAIGNYSGPSTLNLTNWSGFGYDAGSGSSISNSIDLGNTSVTRIQGQVLMSIYSDGRIKENVLENVPGLDFILKLRPVTYNLNIHKQNELLYEGQKNTEDWTGKYDIEKIRMTGFIAQEVAKASADIGYDFNGVDKPETADGLYGLRYSEFVMPLVKAVQELNAVNEAQKVQNDELKQTIVSMSTSIEEMKAQNEKLMQRLEKLESK
ncbi:MAG: tail fiber domain-containing protein [Bacteroidales bacterium]|nr:tail fiber domain-containing protein [Bacteroidales bacterium]